MGKVGSISTYNAILRALDVTAPLGREYRNSRFFLIHRHVFFGLPSAILWRAKLGLPLRVVCPIREPIARDVSGFFEFYCSRVPNLFENTNIAELKELFLADSRPNPFSVQGIYRGEHQYTLSWFDNHFKPLTRIDLYKKPFPIDRKWQTYNRGFTRVLLYRNDLKRSEQARLISRFLGIKLDEVGDENTYDQHPIKATAKFYSLFRESVKLPEPYIRRMHDSRFAKHFWSPEELKVAADKWRVAPDS